MSHSTTHPIYNGAYAIIDQLDANKVDCIFASPIAIMAPVWEVFAARENKINIRYFRCRHELLAVSLAYGYFKVKGKPQAVFLPSSLGVLNGSMALRSSLQERIPMLVISPDSLTYGEDATTDPGPEWPSLLVDFAGPAIEGERVVKWSKKAITSSDLVQELNRAQFIANAVPRGPVLLEVSFDILLHEAPKSLPPVLASSPVVATKSQIEEITNLLASASLPIIITEYGGRTKAEKEQLIHIAETLAAPVFEFMMPAYHNFPRSHPLYGFEITSEILNKTDVILLIGCNAPWHPPHRALMPDCTVIHLEEDPLRPRAPYWGYKTTHTIAGDRFLNMKQISASLEDKKIDNKKRANDWSRYSNSIREKNRKDAQEVLQATKQGIPASELFRVLHDTLPENCACIDEIVAQVPQMLNHLYSTKLFQQFRGWCGALGTGLGTALGVKLASPDRLVVCIIGDGAWHYNPVPAALGFSQEYGLPLFIVLCNNNQYLSQTWNIQKYFPNGAAVKNNHFVGNLIQPEPDYCKTVESYGGQGLRVKEISELKKAINKGLQSIQTGKTFLLDVKVAP
ncbi:thiamine pyrophosphate-dependent enzyme [Microbulbifer sp. SSSA007]|uniref:thiamine pyrophosphate-dependent enzyme n=1 Tax=Microbulbifer sp. SSSA007 TaxID=3243379 RepID=UPI004039DDE7